MQKDQESRTVSSLRNQIRKLQERLEFIEDSRVFQDPDSPSSFGSARDSRMQRNTRGDMSIPGSVSDCQPARRVLDELHNDSRNLASSSRIQRREDYIYLAFREKLRKSRDDRKLS